MFIVNDAMKRRYFFIWNLQLDFFSNEAQNINRYKLLNIFFRKWEKYLLPNFL